MPSLPIHATPGQQSRAVDLRRWDRDAPFYRGSVNTGDGDTALIFTSDGQLELLLVSFGVRRRHFSGGAFVISIARLRSSSSTPYTRYNNKLNTTFEVHRLAFLTCLSPRFPVLQFGAAFSSPAFSDPAFLTVPRFPVSRFQSSPLVGGAHMSGRCVSGCG